MFQYISFALIYGIMIFIWSFVYLNKSKDKVNQSFLFFLSVILIWMVLSISDSVLDSSTFALIIKTLYFYCMMNMSLAFLLFIYRLINKKPDILFWSAVILNTLTLISRYFFPIDYTDPTFWRLSLPVVAPMMSAIFSLPAVYALFLVLRTYFTSKDKNLKRQLIHLFVGIGIALFISVLSEFVLPVWLHVDTDLSLMYAAILVFVIYIFISITKFKFLNIQSDYIYKKLFLTSVEGILLVKKNLKIISINEVAKGILKNDRIESGDKINDYIKDYNYDSNYKQQEATVQAGGQERCLILSQHPISPEDKDSVKLLMISDITDIKQKLKQEKDILIERSSIDLLTGLYNKQYILSDYFSDKSAIKGGKLALLFIDIDDFKNINDVYGHLAGDIVLKTVADCIKAYIDLNAKAARFGGDEFLVIFDHGDGEAAYRTAETIRMKASELELAGCGSQKLTLSIGVVEGTASMIEVIAMADRAMYESKSAGKNRTTVFGAAQSLSQTEKKIDTTSL